MEGERWLDIIFDAKIENEFLDEGHILVDANKFVTKDPILEQTSIKPLIIARCIPFMALKGLPTLNIDIKASYPSNYITHLHYEHQ
jgi:hypothetical protein